MSTAAAFTLEPAAGLADWSRSVAEHDLALLGRLAEVGFEITEALREQAKGGAVVVQGDVALAYDRVARAVRHTVMLRAKLVEVLRDGETILTHRRASAQAGAARILREVIDDERADKERTERLGAEAAERLRAEDFGDLLVRPFGEAVAGICRDIGLTPDWLKLAEDCCKAEADLSRKPGEASKTPEPEQDGPIDILWLDANGRPYNPDRPRDSS